MKTFLTLGVIIAVFAGLGKMDGNWLAIGLILTIIGGWIWFQKYN